MDEKIVFQEDSYQAITVKFRKSHLKQLAQITNKTGKSRNAIIEILLDEALKRVEIDNEL